MTRLQFFSILTSVLIVFDFVSSQVNKNVDELAYELYVKGNVFGPTSQWFFAPRMTELGKFMLCVDVYQKILGINLLGTYYVTENGTTNLPSFEWGVTTIRNNLPYIRRKEVNKYLMHCPLHKVRFLTPNLNGTEFYISEDSKNICVYVLVPNTERLLNLQAKVCDLLINVRYDKKILNGEVAMKMNTGLEDFKWSKTELNNEMRFITCLGVHEKLTRSQLYSQPFTAFNTENEIPQIFDIEHKNFFFFNGTHNVEIKNLEVLYCPLDKFKFHEHGIQKPVEGIASFYLAKSFHHDCVYKLEMPDFFDNQDASFLFLKAEICGILGDYNYGTDNLEIDLIRRLKHSQDQSFYALPWKELSFMNGRVRLEMCFNVLKKMKKQYALTTRSSKVNSNRIFISINSYLLKFVNGGMPNIPTNILTCPMGLATYTHNDTFYLAASPRLGCFYILTAVGVMTLKIDDFICGIYSTRHLLKLDVRSTFLPSV